LKIRRIRRNPHVLVASCRVNGKLRREPVAARAEVLTAGADLEHVQKLLLARYKISYRVVMLFYRLGRRLRGKQSVADGAALAITLD
jgi:PPOX class probable F420-dependent enzyme